MNYLRQFLSFSVFFFIILLSGCQTNNGKQNHKDDQLIEFKGKKDHLLIFTGSDWSDDAHNFVKNVITEELFSALKSDYTVHHIDLPRNVPESKQLQLRKNYLLFSRYGVTDIPFVVLQTAKNDVYAAEAVQNSEKFPKALIAKIKALTAARQSVVQARNRIDNTTGVEKAQAIDSFLSKVLYAYDTKYNDLRLQVPALDPENISGLRGKYLLIRADIQAKKYAQKNDIPAACNEYIEAAQLPELSASQKQLAWFLAANTYLYSQKDVDNQVAIQYLKNSIAADPNGDGVPSMKQMIEELKN